MFLKNDILIFKQNLYFKLIALFIIFSSCKERNSIDLNTVFRYNEHKNINSLDPIFAKDIANIQAVNQLFNGLVEMDKELNVVPSIAKSWKISENGKLYTFNINTSVKFHPHPSLKKRNVTVYLSFPSFLLHWQRRLLESFVGANTVKAPGALRYPE